jgi:hypothetical protein
MKKASQNQRTKKPTSTKKPSDPRAYPLAKDSRGSAARDEIRAKAPKISAPRQSNRPTQKGNTKSKA